MKAFNDLADFSVEEISELLQLSIRLDRSPEPNALRGKVLALLFLNPSLRTLASFQAAMTRLGGGSFVISPEMSIHGLVTRPGIVMDGVAAEHIREAVPVIASYGDAIGIRAFAERRSLEEDLVETEFNALVDLIDIPYINMESAVNHPCQSLADWKTLNDLNIPANGGKFVLSWVYHPKPQPLAVPAATLHMAAYRGMEITVLRPPGFELPAKLMRKAQRAAETSGGTIRETEDRAEATEDAQIVYVKSWSSQHYGRSAEDSQLRNELKHWCVDETWFDNAAENCRMMHCMPVRRGVEVDDVILDSPRSVVIQEAHNRMLVQMAVLHEMLGTSS